MIRFEPMLRPIQIREINFLLINLFKINNFSKTIKKLRKFVQNLRFFKVKKFGLLFELSSSSILIFRATFVEETFFAFENVKFAGKTNTTVVAK